MFSVVIPLFNKQDTIIRALDSVCSQTPAVQEVLVIDDGSRDDGPSLVGAYPDKRVQLIRQANAGVSAARNTGMQIAKANYIAFLDADDQWLPNFISCIHDLIVSFPEAATYATAYQYVYGNGTRFRPPNLPDSNFFGLLDFFEVASRGWCPLHSSAVVIDRRVISSVGLFSTKYAIGEDLEYWCRLQLVVPCAYHGQCGSSYFSDTPNNAMSKAKELVCHSVFVSPACDFLFRALVSNQIDPKMESAIRNYIDFRILSAARGSLMSGRPDRARGYLARISGRQNKTTIAIYRILALLPGKFTVFMLMGLKSARKQLNRLIEKNR